MFCTYSGASVHERPCSRTIRFTNKFSEKKTSLMTNGFSDYEHVNWQQRQAESISAGVSCWLTLAQYTSLLISVCEHFGSRTASRNGLSSWIEAPLYSYTGHFTVTAVLKEQRSVMVTAYFCAVYYYYYYYYYWLNHASRRLRAWKPSRIQDCW
jgi:hypothetical protein